MAIFSNRATLTYNGVATDSNVAFGEILEVLTVEKTAIDTTYAPDGLVTYAVTLRNSGNTALTGLTVTDDLGGYAFDTTTLYPLDADTTAIRLFVNGVPQANPTATAGPPLTISGITIPAGGNAVVVYQARANQFANPGTGGTIVNTATVSGAGLTAPVTATATVTGAADPVLTITKSISPAQVADNDRVTYTIVIQNAGNTPVELTDNATVSDTLDPILTALTVTYNGTTWTPGTEYTYDEGTGLFTTLPGQIAVPAATVTQDPTTGAYTVTPGTATITITGTV